MGTKEEMGEQNPVAECIHFSELHDGDQIIPIIETCAQIFDIAIHEEEKSAPPTSGEPDTISHVTGTINEGAIMFVPDLIGEQPYREISAILTAIDVTIPLSINTVQQFTNFIRTIQTRL